MSFFALSFFAAWHIFAAEALDTQMSPEEKKQTGVYKLDDNQKAALQQWIDAHYQKRADGETSDKKISGKNPILSENLMNSRFLRLSDNTLWSVRAEDVPIAQGWITPVEIVITQSSDPFFPYRLTNKLTGSSILARKVESLPSQPQTTEEEASSTNKEAE